MVNLEDETLDWSLKHCQDYSLNFVPTPFEFVDIANNWDEIKKVINSTNLKRWKVRPLRKFFVPKDSVSHRIITELDPIDHIIYAGLIYEIGEDIENNRSPKVDKNVFSYRYMPNSNGSLYDPNYNFMNFLEHCQEVAESEDYSYVASTDISDFYLNIYEHRLENNLNHISSKNDHVKAIIHLLKQWNERVSRGIPVGPMASRLLAESILIDIDELLKIEDIQYCRWNDDFRIFADSYEEAYKFQYKLSSKLFTNHSLTLQKSKTNILTTRNFISKYIFPEEREQILTINDEFSDSIIMGSYNDINDSIQYSEEELESFEIEKLEEILITQAGIWEPNFKLMRFLINRLMYFNECSPIESLIDNLDTLYPIISEIMRYLINSDVDYDRKKNIADKLLKAYNMPIIQTIDYVRIWIMYYFVLNPSIIDSTTLNKLYNQERKDDLKREITYIMGEKKELAWVRSKKGNWQNLSPWLQRAYLKSTNCLEDDEKKNFHNSIRKRLDPICELMIG